MNPLFKPFVSAVASGVVLTGALLPAFGEPRVPQRDDEVVAVLPAGSVVRRARAAGLMASNDPVEAARSARRWLEASRGDGNTRNVGRAQAALMRWWHDASPPLEILLLRATVKQALHDFEPALRDLDALLVRDAGNVQAWMSKSTLHALRGEWDAARQAAIRVAPLAGRLAAAGAAAAVAGMNGQLGESLELLARAMREDRSAPRALKLWSLTLMGEMADRAGDAARAEASFRGAGILGLQDAYLRLAHADFLLRQDRPAEVADVLAQGPSSEAAILRLALAEQRLHPGSPRLTDYKSRLARGFDAARARGSALHRREEARFALELLDDPGRAVRLALENWQVQREPADVKILLDAALASGQAGVVEQVRQWVAASGYQDVHVQRLLDKQVATR